MPSGPTPPNPSELLRSQKMQDLVEVLEESFDLVIFDMPPVVTVTDAQILSAYVDGTILVIRERATKKQAVIEAKKCWTWFRQKSSGSFITGRNRGMTPTTITVRKELSEQ